MKVYVIGGKAEQGKDTFGNYLIKYYEERNKKGCILHFSSYLKNYAITYFGWDPQKEEKPRELLQKLGQEIIREKLNKPYFLIDRATEDIEILSHFFDVFILTDARLPLELETLKERFPNVVTVKIQRPGYPEKMSEDEKGHLTETALDNYELFDYEIENTTLEKLENDAKEIVRKEELKVEKK